MIQPPFTPSSTPNTVRSADGKVHSVPDGWSCFHPAILPLHGERNSLPAIGSLRKRKAEDSLQGHLGTAVIIEQICAEFEAERTTEGHAKRKEFDARARDILPSNTFSGGNDLLAEMTN